MVVSVVQSMSVAYHQWHGFGGLCASFEVVLGYNKVFIYDEVAVK